MLNRKQQSANRVKTLKSTKTESNTISNEESYTENVEYYTFNSSNLIKTKNYSEAIGFLNKAIEINPNSSDALREKGMALYHLKEFKEAAVCFSKVIELDPSDTEALFKKGRTLYKLKNYKEAEECFNQVLEYDKNFGKLFYYKGMINLKSKRHNDAIECFNKSIKEHQHIEESYLNKAISLSKLNKVTEAEEAFNQAFNLNQNLRDSNEYLKFIKEEKEKNKLKIDSQTNNVAVNDDVLDSSKLNKFKQILNDFHGRFVNFEHFIENNSFYLNIIDKNSSIYNFVKEKILNSMLNKKLLFRINLNTAKLLETNKLIISRIKKIEELKHNSSNSSTEVTHLTESYSEIFNSLNSVTETQVKKIISSSDSTTELTTTKITEILISSVTEYITSLNKCRHEVFDTKIETEKKNTNEEIVNFLNSISQLLNTNKLDFVCDLAYLAIDFIVIARAIFGLNNKNFEEYSNYFRFSCDPIKLNSIVDGFNSNIISIKLNEYIKQEKFLELKENDIVKCDQCSSIVSLFTLVDRENKWKCNFCQQINNNKPFKKINQANVVYKKKIDLNQKIESHNKNIKIVVFCIDISKSMKLIEDDIDNDNIKDDRLYIMKKASIEILKKIKEKNPDYKVVLISFSSETIYYGHGESNQIIDENSLSLDNVENTDNIQPIRKSYNLLKNKINDLKINFQNKTLMKSMLYKSVQLAASIDNSDVIIFSDGKPQDDSKIDVNCLTDYCKLNGSIIINFLTFYNVEIDRFLQRICINTNGNIFHLSYLKQVEQFFEKIIRQPNSEYVKQAERFKFKIQCNKEIILNKTLLTQEEVLERLNLERVNFDKNCLYAYFQFEFDMKDSIRVYTTKIKLDRLKDYNLSKINKEIIAAFSLRKLADLVEINNEEIVNFWSLYSKFIEKTGQVKLNNELTKLIEKISKARNKKELKFKEDEIVLLLKNKNICSFDINSSIKNNIQTNNEQNLIDYPKYLFNLYCINQEDYKDVYSFDSDELKSFDDFKSNLQTLFNTFELNNLVNPSLENFKLIKRVVIGVELIKYSNYIIKMIKNSFQEKQESNIEKYVFSKDRTFDEFFNEILFIFSDFENIITYLKEISNGSCEWNSQKNSCLDSLYKEFNEYIYESDNSIKLSDDHMLKLLNQISFNLIQQIRNTSFEAEHFNNEIKKEIRMKKVTKILQEIERVENVDICFLMDCTGSMASYIEECKTSINNIVDNLKKEFKNLKIRPSFLGYYDFESKDSKYNTFKFEENLSEDFREFKEFIQNKVKAEGGGLQCEDVFGGLNGINEFNWTNPSRILIHIADAPCHGSRFHDSKDDEFPDGDPNGLNITDLLKNLVIKKIHYYFTKINESTNKMVEEFNKELENLLGNQITEINLTHSKDLAEIVSKMIRKTIYTNRRTTIQTNGMSFQDIETDWNYTTFSNNNMNLYKIDYYAPKYFTEYAEIKYKSIDFENKKNCELWLAKKPFTKSSQEIFYTGKLNDENIILKKLLYLDPDYNTITNYKELVEKNMVASILFNSFKERLESSNFTSIKFTNMNLVYVKETDSFYSSEEYIQDAKFIKDYELNDESLINTLNAFFHWTYEATDEFMLISGCKLICGKSNIYLSSPIVSFSKDFDRFFSTNLGKEGLKMFAKSHICNSICSKLKLKRIGDIN